MTVQRSPISAISSIRCEMKITAAPASARSRRSANRRSRVATSSADVASSRMRMRGSRTSARARQHACRSLRDSRSTGVSSGGRLAEQRVEYLLRPPALLGGGDTAGEHAVGPHPDVLQHRARLDDEYLLEDGGDAGRRGAPRGAKVRHGLRRRARACRRRAGERRRGSSRAWTCRTRSRRRRSAPRRGAARTSTSAAPASARTPWRARSCATRSRCWAIDVGGHGGGIDGSCLGRHGPASSSSSNDLHLRTRAQVLIRVCIPASANGCQARRSRPAEPRSAPESRLASLP